MQRSRETDSTSRSISQTFQNFFRGDTRIQELIDLRFAKADAVGTLPPGEFVLSVGLTRDKTSVCSTVFHTEADIWTLAPGRTATAPVACAATDPETELEAEGDRGKFRFPAWPALLPGLLMSRERSRQADVKQQF